MKTTTLLRTSALAITILSAITIVPGASSQDISWRPATGITGDANLAVGNYFDAFIPNQTTPAPLTADEITFNVDTIVSSTSTSDGIITATVTAGDLNNYNGNSFPSTAPSSPAFAAIMNAGGIYDDGGAGAGTVTITGLTVGQTYAVQIFNYASDNDAGLTTFTSSNSVTLSNAQGAGGASTYGEFATGTFIASSGTETFTWAGAGSAYTVLGAIYVCNLPNNQSPVVSQDTTPSSVTTYQFTTTTFTAIFSGTTPITNQWYVSTDGGNTFNPIGGATNNTLTVTNNAVVSNVEYYLMASNAYGSNHSTAASLTVLPTPPQSISWGPAIGIAGDNSLQTNGTYVDAYIPDTLLSSGLTADGVVFNSSTSSSSSGGSDGIISFTVISGDNLTYDFTTFPTNSPSSPAFAAIMNAGGTYENGGAGQGIVTISGLTNGHIYSVQIFNYANDGDAGLTTFSGTTNVTLSNLPGAGGANTYGEFATGTFTASSTNESFYWNGAGSGFTVLGAISVRDISAASAPILSGDTTPSSATLYIGSTITFSAYFVGPLPITNQWQISTDNGATFQNVNGATGTSLTLTNNALVTNVLYRLVASNPYGSNHSTAASLTVTPPPPQTVYWEGVQGITGDANLSTDGTYVDALVVNSSEPALAVDGITFNAATSQSGGYTGDGVIDYTGIGSSLNNFAWPGGFTGSASANFTSLMDDGGFFQFGGAGQGRILISGLTNGHVYLVQVFNFAPDGDPGLTTFSGVNSATLDNLPGAGGANTYGEYATGSFMATGSTEMILWNGAGSSYTVVGSVSLRDVTGVVETNSAPLISTVVNKSLQLSWPPDHTGWQLQMQSNPLNAGLKNNWVNVSGSTATNTTNIPIASTNGCVFFRLVYP
ncbi:MAG TPA: hypothetical protein VNU95_15695 [Candidatus Acidoferrales bacterium]|jgi:hypothetical protein|nr:hypothetical protein [Candidatus Acidoferrales bacterium]